MSIASHSIIILSDLKLYEMNFEAIIKYLESQEYKVIQELGEGTFGVVYSTENASKNPTYSAMKISLYKEKHQTQYRRELNILSNQKLSRQFIVQYYSSDGEVLINNIRYQFIQMELCWISLSTVFSDHRKVLKGRHPPRFYQHVFPQILQGLDAIHSIGWVHRDIHLGNILILRQEAEIRDIRIKIADFGNAREIKSIMETHGSQTVSSEPSFTLPYGAPEEGTGRYNYKVDIFSAGIVLCQISCYNWSQESSASRPFTHQDDDILLDFITTLTRTNPVKRPSAEEALKSTWKDKKVYVKRSGNTSFCLTTDNTLSSLKAAIERSTNKLLQSEDLLFQEKVTNSKAKLVPLKCDEDVKRMFQEAEQVSIMVVKKDQPIEL